MALHIWTGLGGCTDDYSFLFEWNVAVFAMSNGAVGAEYRQQLKDYTPIGNLVKASGVWWTLVAASVVNKHLTLSGDYGHFGGVLSHDANGV